MSLRLINSLEEFQNLEVDWNQLSIQPLRSFDWHIAWWNQFGDGNQLRVYTWKDKGEIVGIAPFFVDRWLGQNRLRFIGGGDTCTDYAEIISQPDCRTKFAQEIARDISDENLIQLIELEGVHGSNFDDSLVCALSGSHWRYDVDLEPTWVIQLPKAWDKFLSDAKGSLRRKIRKAIKRFDKGEVTVQSTRNGLSFDLAFQTLVDLHQERFVSKGEPGVFADSRFTEFLKDATRRLVETDRAEIIVASDQDGPFVAHHYLLSEEGPQLYQSGVRISKMNLEPGHLLFTHAVRQAIEDGYPTFDFLRGNESYKPFWGAAPRDLLKIRMVSNRLSPTAVNQTYRFLRNVKHTCVGLMNSSRANPAN